MAGRSDSGITDVMTMSEAEASRLQLMQASLVDVEDSSLATLSQWFEGLPLVEEHRILLGIEYLRTLCDSFRDLRIEDDALTRPGAPGTETLYLGIRPVRMDIDSDDPLIPDLLDLLAIRDALSPNAVFIARPARSRLVVKIGTSRVHVRQKVVFKRPKGNGRR